MKPFYFAFILSIFLSACNEPENGTKHTLPDVYEQEPDTSKEVKQTEVANPNLIGHYIAYTSIKGKNILNKEAYYHVQMDFIDPMGYCPRNLFNEGQEWYLSGNLKDGFLVMSGDNINGSKRIGGSIELVNNGHDTLFVSLSVKSPLTDAGSQSSEVAERREEIWVKKN